MSIRNFGKFLCEPFLSRETGKVVWVTSFRPFTSSDQYKFSDTLICQMDVSTFSWQTNVTKMCPKYLLTLRQNWSSQYQIQINRTGDINNVKIVEVWTLCANRNIHCPPFTGLSGCADKSAAELYETTTTTIWPIHGVCVQYVLLFRDAYDLTSRPSGKRIRLLNPRSRVDSRVGTYYRLCFFPFPPCNAKSLHTSNMELYKWQKLHSLTI